ncbi:hypothetical protein BC834DRAFT_852580 [Gloeopeniophorella convolvens]|nr:hypothetical protein BC834DRAFT_852580 [Gloeopeniophorella convolvens]
MSLFVGGAEYLSFKDALIEYTRLTGLDLATHPLISELGAVKSAHVVLATLQDHLQHPDGILSNSWGTRLADSLVLVLGAVLALHDMLDEVSVSPTAVLPGAIFCGIDVLLSATACSCTSNDALYDLFGSLGKWLETVEVMLRSTASPRSALASQQLLVRVLADVLFVLASATERLKQGQLWSYGEKISEDEEVGRALERLRKVVQPISRRPSLVHSISMPVSRFRNYIVAPLRRRHSSDDDEADVFYCDDHNDSEDESEMSDDPDTQLEDLLAISHTDFVSAHADSHALQGNSLSSAFEILVHGCEADLHYTQDDVRCEKAFARLVQEWYYTGASLLAVVGIDAAVFSLSPDSLLGASVVIKHALAISSVSAALGLCSNIWLVLAYAGTGTRRFQRLSQDLHGSCLLDLTLRLPLLALAVAVLALVGCLAAIAWSMSPVPVLVLSVLATSLFSLQFVGGMNRCAARILAAPQFEMTRATSYVVPGAPGRSLVEIPMEEV